MRRTFTLCISTVLQGPPLRVFPDPFQMPVHAVATACDAHSTRIALATGPEVLLGTALPQTGEYSRVLVVPFLESMIWQQGILQLLLCFQVQMSFGLGPQTSRMS